MAFYSLAAWLIPRGDIRQEMKPGRSLAGFEAHELGAGHCLLVGRLPSDLMSVSESFEALWNLHPEGYYEIKMHGRLVKTPRWQQAYGRDYAYSGRVNKSLPVPSSLEPFLRWGCEKVEPRLNGILVNWYDAALGHYIGRHRDSTKELVRGTSIVTISLGDDRTFRVRPWAARVEAKPVDFPSRKGAVFVMPWETNLAFTHEVPRSAAKVGRRISITLRAFAEGASQSDT